MVSGQPRNQCPLASFSTTAALGRTAAQGNARARNQQPTRCFASVSPLIIKLMSDTEPAEEPVTTITPDEDVPNVEEGVVDEKQRRPKPAPRKAAIVIREEGRSLLPHSRVQKIIKADKVSFRRYRLVSVSYELIYHSLRNSRRSLARLSLLSRWLPYVISLPRTKMRLNHFQKEEFVKKLSISSFKEAERDNRSTVQTKDVGEYSNLPYRVFILRIQ